MMQDNRLFLTGQTDQQHLLHFQGNLSQPAITCSKLTIETLEQGVKCVQS